MIFLGVVLLILGLLFSIQPLWILGVILIVAGLFLFARPASFQHGRRWY